MSRPDPHQDVEARADKMRAKASIRVLRETQADRDQKREQLDRQQQRAETAEAEVERLREAWTRSAEEMDWLADLSESQLAEADVERIAKEVIERFQALAPSPDDRGGERCPTCKGSHWLNESKLLDGGPMPTACPDCNSDGSKPLAFRAADQSRETSE